MMSRQLPLPSGIIFSIANPCVDGFASNPREKHHIKERSCYLATFIIHSIPFSLEKRKRSAFYSSNSKKQQQNDSTSDKNTKDAAPTQPEIVSLYGWRHTNIGRETSRSRSPGSLAKRMRPSKVVRHHGISTTRRALGFLRGHVSPRRLVSSQSTNRWNSTSRSCWN